MKILKMCKRPAPTEARAEKKVEWVDKPGSVVDGHSSAADVAICL